ncbi:MAG TPA: Ig-like domain-containing protein, partial [Gammaproteobacteria bacterium]|nr:Ig-like domain-containing protein [Gammaproteobacteria bacterium]
MSYMRGLIGLAVVSVVLLLAACGGGGGNALSPDSSSGNQTTNPDVASIELRTSNSTMGTSPSSSVQLTAVAKDKNNRVMDGVDVAFSTSSGELTVDRQTTDASGTALATFKPGQNAANRTATIEAAAGNFKDSVTVSIGGTQVNLSGPTSLTQGATQSYTAKVTDSSGNPVYGATFTVSSKNGNTISS